MLGKSARRLVDRLMRTATARRVLASIRWRSGLDDELHEIRSRTDCLPSGLEAICIALTQDVRNELHDVRDELQEIRSRTDGLPGRLEAARAALAKNIRDVSDGLGGRLRVLEGPGGLRSGLEALDARVEGLEFELPGLKTCLRGFETGLTALDARLAELGGRQATAVSEAEQLGSRLSQQIRDGAEDVHAKIAGFERATGPAVVWADILFHSTWSALAPLSEEPKVSIVLATRNRSVLLRRAVESVIAQSYPTWELIVVNDASTDDTKSTIQAIGDSRIKLIDSDGSGAGHARNIGLRAASGSLNAFLDDDNLMAPGWLRAVVVAFQGRPELNAVYGAQLRSGARSSPVVRSLLFVTPFDRERMAYENFIDLGVLAHRNGLGLTFDESLPRAVDWDYVVRVAGRFGMEPLPAVASFYTTDAPARISFRALHDHESEAMRRRFREAFGMVSETDNRPAEETASVREGPEVGNGVRALATRGTDKAWMTPADADLLEGILDRLARRFGGELRVLEWGSGLSTLHYPAWLSARGVRVSWTTIEHDRALFRHSIEAELRARDATIVWSEELRDTPLRLGGDDHTGVVAVVFDKGPINPFDGNPMRDAERAKDLDDYVGFPAAHGARFHVTIVDGRKRRRCLLEAAALLEPGGIALLHDAQRPYYHGAFAAFRSGRRIGDELWIGAQETTDFSDLVSPEALESPGIDYTPGT
jgi:glycosyl transferase family 2